MPYVELVPNQQWSLQSTWYCPPRQPGPVTEGHTTLVAGITSLGK